MSAGITNRADPNAPVFNVVAFHERAAIEEVARHLLLAPTLLDPHQPHPPPSIPSAAHVVLPACSRAPQSPRRHGESLRTPRRYTPAGAHQYADSVW